MCSSITILGVTNKQSIIFRGALDQARAEIFLNWVSLSQSLTTNQTDLQVDGISQMYNPFALCLIAELHGLVKGWYC